jgi:hypothetical protein
LTWQAHVHHAIARQWFGAWADSYLAAFAAMSHVRVGTFDGALRAKAEHAVLLKE